MELKLGGSADFMNDLAMVIRYHRKKSGLNRVELAKLAGVGKTVIFNLEHAKVDARLHTLIKIMKVLNINLEFKSPFMASFQKEHK